MGTTTLESGNYQRTNTDCAKEKSNEMNEIDKKRLLGLLDYLAARLPDLKVEDEEVYTKLGRAMTIVERSMYNHDNGEMHELDFNDDVEAYEFFDEESTDSD